MIIKELLTHEAVSGDRHSSALSQSENIVALVGLGVCDGAHRLVVMKKDRGRIAGGDDGGIPRLEKPRDGRPQSQGITGFVLFCIVAIGEL